jgi:hypothetical protein
MPGTPLAADVLCSSYGVPIKVGLSANGADTFYRGALVHVDTGGGVQSVPAAGDRCIGISPEKQVTKTAGDTVQVIVDGLVWLPIGSGISVADEGDFLVMDISAQLTDNPTECKALADITPVQNDCVIGQILKVETSRMLIAIIPGITGRIMAATATNLWV